MIRFAGGRMALSLLLIAVSGVLLVAGGVALYGRTQLVDERSFADRAVNALDDEDVREVVSEEIVTEMIDQGAAELLTVRPLLTTGVAALLDTPQFRRLFRGAVRDAHRLFLERGDGGLVIELANASDLVVEGLASVSPEIAEDVPRNLEPEVAELREGEFATEVVRTADSVRVLGLVLPWLGFAGFAIAIAIAPSRRAAVTGLGMAIAAGGAAVVVALLVWRALAVESVEETGLLESAQVRGAAGAAWDAYLGDLRLWSFVAVGGGLILIAIGGAGLRPGEIGASAARLAGQVVLGPAARPARLVRGTIAIGLGALLLLEPTLALQLAALGLGGLLVLVGTDEVVAAIERGRRAEAPGAVRRRLLAAGAGALGAALLVVTAVLLAAVLREETRSDERPVPPQAEQAGGCNGAPQLCERRLNQVVFPATHNSYSAAEEPGWVFANQRFPIARQLEDGIRGLLLDVHVGVRAPNGRVRTDIQSEGVTRNRVARRLSPRALRLADSLAGRVGLGQLFGRRELFLCHTLCELGAEPLDEVLTTIRRFLERNPSEVLIVVIEPLVPPASIDAAFSEAGLLEHVTTLRRDQPLPSLARLIESKRRLVVFNEEGGPGPGWYHPAFSFIQDTPIGEAPRGDCRANRGDGNSPLLMLNNWVDDFPPSPTANRRLGRSSFILDRVERCRQRRRLTPSLIAVDFYDMGAVVDVARELNGRTPEPVLVLAPGTPPR